MDANIIVVEACWCKQSSSTTSLALVQHVQKTWDDPIMKAAMDTITAAARTDIDLARLKAASYHHPGDWLYAAQIASVGLKLTDAEIQVAVFQKLGASACCPHLCLWQGDRRQVPPWPLLYEERCKTARYAMLNDAIWKEVERAQVQANNEPVGLCHTRRKAS